MKIEDIFEMWGEDAIVDPTDLSAESVKVPKLHHKYYQIHSREYMLLKKKQEEFKVLYRDKYEYYRGQLDYETMKSRGWEPFELKVMKGDVGIYMEADTDIINANLSIALQQEKVDVLKAIIKDLSQRSYHINNAIDFQKFQMGA